MLARAVIRHDERRARRQELRDPRHHIRWNFDAVQGGTREPADAAAETLPQVDAVLRAAVTSQDVPGVVAMAATETGLVYEGAFGSIENLSDLCPPSALVGQIRQIEEGSVSGSS